MPNKTCMNCGTSGCDHKDAMKCSNGRCLWTPLEAEVRAEAQEPVTPANDSKLRFFRDMTSTERRKVFEVFGIESALLNEARSLGDEVRVFNHLFPTPQPPAKQEAQKPVAKFLYDQLNGLGKVEWLPHHGPVLQHGQLFYTTPQQQSPCQKCGSHAGMSWGGNNVYGDAGSINSVKEAVHYAGQVPEFKKIIQSMQAKVAELLEELEEWRMTNKIDELYRELDREKAKVAEQAAEIARLREEIQGAASMNGKLIDQLVEKDATIAQQAERIAEQSALIEKCETALNECSPQNIEASHLKREALAAIAAHRGQS